MNNLDRIKQIESTTLTSVSLTGSHKMVSHDDFRFLIDQANQIDDWQQLFYLLYKDFCSLENWRTDEWEAKAKEMSIELD